MIHRTSVLTLVAFIGTTMLHVQPSQAMQALDRYDLLSPAEKALHDELLSACRFADVLKAAEVLRKCPKLAALTGKYGTSPLYNVCSGTVAPNEQVAIIDLLTEQGASVDDCYGNNLISALHAVCRIGYGMGSAAVMDKLLANKAPVDCVDSEERTPLHYACWYGSDSSKIRLLCEAASTQNVAHVINLKDQEGNTALHYASRCSHYSPNIQALESLLDYDIDINAVNNAGQTPLHLLCSKANGSDVKYAIKLLLEKKIIIDGKEHDAINIDIKDKKGSTAFAYYITRYELPLTCAAWTLENWKTHFGIPPA